MQVNSQLKHRFVHLPHGETAVSCSGLHIRDDESHTASPEKSTWVFTSPSGGPKLNVKVKASTLSDLFRDAAIRISDAGYALPDGFGLLVETNLTNVTIKSKVIQVRVNSEGLAPQRISSQFDRFSFTIYDDAMQNALKLRDLLVGHREDNRTLRAQAK